MAFRQGAVPEVLGDAGVLVDDKDPVTVADAVARLQNDGAAAGGPGRLAGRVGRLDGWPSTGPVPGWSALSVEVAGPSAERPGAGPGSASARRRRPGVTRSTKRGGERSSE